MPARRTFAVPALLSAFLFLAISNVHATSTIGLYTDETGTSCTFNGNNPGPMVVYVIVRPDPAGLRAVRFQAQAPPCLGASWLSDAAADGALTIGSSPEGIAVAVGHCASQPTYMLQITYLRTSTTACCEFALSADPWVGIIEGVDCALNTNTMTSVTSHFNPDATCPCHDGVAPYPPQSPAPHDYATYVLLGSALSWSPSPFDGDILEYDLYFGTSSTPPLVATLTSPTYQPAVLLGSTTYFWRVVVRDAEGLTTSGPVWRFTTEPANVPPTLHDPSPPNLATGVNPNFLILRWVASDPNGDPVRSDVYFGTTSPPPLVSSNRTSESYIPTGVTFDTQYYWQIVVKDNKGASTTGPVWQFRTKPVNSPPTAPTAVFPTPNAVNIPNQTDLSWQCTDPEGDVLKYDVYFGTSTPPPLLASNHTTKTYDVGLMAISTTYFWKIIARDPAGLTAESAIFTFSTQGNQPPGIPANPNPTNGATGIGFNPTLTWTSTDETPATLKYDVYFGTTTSPSLVASNITTASYSPGPLTHTTIYRWRIVARDAEGLFSSGPVWLFYSASPPTAFNPLPANNGFGAAPLTLAWTCSQPNGGPATCDLYFGTTNPPPLIVTGMSPSTGNTGFSYALPDPLQSGTRYYWGVRSYDSVGSTTNPVWSFTAAQAGDVNLDGLLTTADASCALNIALNNPSCAAAGASSLAGVNCEPGVTARDALCIHRRAVGQACTFCGESLVDGFASPASPVVTRSSYWYEGNNLFITLAVSGVSNLEAFTFWVHTPGNASLTGAVRRGATAGFDALATNLGSTVSPLGGYALTPVNAASTVDFIELRFIVSGTLTGYIAVDTFTDDLFGAGSLTILSGNGKGGGGNLPVTFSRFDANVHNGAVRVDWEVKGEDVLDTYTLYRRAEAGASFLPISHGHVDRMTGSYLDRAVDAGKTYQYEMSVLAADGDEFLSPIVTVEVPALGLSLGANHPNPFNPQTTIPYSVPVGPSPVRVRIAVYETSGRLVRVLVDEEQAGGPRDVVWNGDDTGGYVVTSGVYFCVLQVGNERRTQKMVLLK